MQMAGNLWHPYDFLKATKEHLQHAYPYWNRSAGTDHVFFLTTDRGAPPAAPLPTPRCPPRGPPM
eukprot:3367575-Prymnesium_polylepis.1